MGVKNEGSEGNDYTLTAAQQRVPISINTPFT